MFPLVLNYNLVVVLNARTRRVDLVCKLAAPLAVGIVLIWITVATTFLAVTGFGLACSFVEIALYRQTWTKFGELHTSRSRHTEDISIPESPPNSHIKESTNTTRANPLVTYFRHIMWIPFFTLSLLYMTTLSFNSVMTTYFLSIGYSATLIAVARSLSVLAGVSATFSFPAVMKRIGNNGGLYRLGLWGVWVLAVCLGAVVAEIFWRKFGSSSESAIQAVLLFGGLTTSRWGLWSFDLAVSQMMQESVIPEEVGAVNGLQFSLQNLFELTSYALTMIWSDPGSFYIPSAASFVAILLAAVMFSAKARKERGHLLHLKKWF
ncbi:Ferroporti-1 [Zopfochytrium polystomum]|nr:Ferroporti-1 [Zopfochytrium polystomum]